MMEPKSVLYKLYSGLTCYWHMSIHQTYQDGRFVLLKHTGHTETLDSMGTRKRCVTYYSLFDANQVESEHVSGLDHERLAMLTINGRLTKKHDGLIMSSIKERLNR